MKEKVAEYNFLPFRPYSPYCFFSPMACDVAVLEGVFGFKLVKRTVLSSFDFHKSKALRLRQALQRVVATNLYENLFSAPNISLLHDRELMRGKTFFTIR